MPSVVAAGLPNIDGAFGFAHDVGVMTDKSTPSGAFAKGTNRGRIFDVGSTPSNCYDADFKASRSNSIYGSSTTVQPPSIKLIPQLRY